MYENLHDVEAKSLTNKINNINTWIKEHKEVKEPNYYEIINYMVEVAALNSTMAQYYDQVGYPKNNDGREYTHYDITKFNPNAKACYEAMNEMQSLRYDSESTSFAKTNEASELLKELSYASFCGEYRIPSNPIVKDLKKEILCKSMSIAYYIYEEEKKNPFFKYDNEKEFEKLKEDYEYYKEAVGVEQTLVDLDGKKYQGPQFGYSIEGLINRIENSYLYNNKSENEIHKTK